MPNDSAESKDSRRLAVPLQFRIAKWIMARRGAALVVFALVTLAFISGLPRVQVRTVFKDLLPKDDPFVQTYYAHPTFGNPLTVFVMIRCKHGTIYNSETLRKTWNFTRDLDLAPSIDHDQLISLSSEKLRYVEATPKGVDSVPIMPDHPPRDVEEALAVREHVLKSPNARAFYVSNDETATLVKATFQDDIEYGKVFSYVQGLVERARDADHEVYLVGQPALTGWVYRLQKQTYTIFAATIALLTLALMLYMRNLSGVVTPIVCAAVAALWGVGFIGWLGRPIEPLLTIVPLLLIARTFSHCIQFCERYYEILNVEPDRRKAAELTMGVMMVPSVLGILTDVFGIVFIAVTPIVTMYNHALFCGAWALWIIPTGVFLAAILLSYLPTPRNFHTISGGAAREAGVHRLQKRILLGLATLTQGRRAPMTLAVVMILSMLAIAASTRVRIGNPVEGSNLLQVDSEYNTGVRALNAHFPGTNTLEIVIESKNPADGSRRVAMRPEAVAIRGQIQALMEADTLLPPRATLSLTDIMAEANRIISGGNPQWLPIDPSPRATFSAWFVAMSGSSMLNFSNVVDFVAQNSAVSIWYADNKQETIDHALASARRTVAIVGEDHAEFRVRLASGTIALQQSMNEVVHRYHWFVLALVNLAILIISALAYRSIVASIVLLVPVNLANFAQVAVMYLLGIGLDINATIVAVLSLGVGIDYGIYLLSRICEEYAERKDWGEALTAALGTTGKAILFTAMIMLAGILPWTFLSDLKFMADMGKLLVASMFINMLLALIVIPLTVWFVKPSFVVRQALVVAAR